MAKRKQEKYGLFNASNMFGHTVLRKRKHLILPRYLKDEASKAYHEGKALERAREVIQRWIDMAERGQLHKKERSLDANFLNEVFGEALRYRTATSNPEEYDLEREFYVPGAGHADGCIGQFPPVEPKNAVAVIELKGANADLDRDKFNGRTPVQQCWDYLRELPDCQWGIVSNFVTIRLYHRDRGTLAFEYFELTDLRDEKRFREFYCLFRREGLLKGVLGSEPLALQLIKETGQHQREVGDKLYDYYSDQRLQLIEHLVKERGHTIDQAINVAQKLLDRIIFIAFCEDRGLLPGQTIKETYREVPRYARATNPRWQNFLALFRAVDKGHKDIALDVGYNGGLFRKDPAVDDLQLDDRWTELFREVGEYDFRDEVNVDVLGHLFEKSITELERLRKGGLFGPGAGYGSIEVAMQKSPERKRFGIYYTPPEFTTFIVEHTLGHLIRERFSSLARDHRVDPDASLSSKPSKQFRSYWSDCLQTLIRLKIVDPACGSGAFLIQAYDLLEETYDLVLENLTHHGDPQAECLRDRIADHVLSDNLYGVDLSTQAVEITQLALWIRSARPGRTLADLSANIVQGNSLVTDPQVDPKALTWRSAFPAVFDGEESGFDCVIGNPPWERMKLQEREFFALSAPDIAGAVNAARRKRRIAELAKTNPDLFARYQEAKERAEATLAHVRACGEYPLTAKGDINTYMIFAELARKIVAPRGRVGLLVPSGIATDNTTRAFFSKLIGARSLVGLFDFENRKRIFPDVDGRFKFSVLLFGGAGHEADAARFVFFAHDMKDLETKDRQIDLSDKDLALLNPNTRTCPVFRRRRDAELTKYIYRRVPVLINRSRKRGGNPWGIRFKTMFHQTNDAGLFTEPRELKQRRYTLEGNIWVRGKKRYLPLYEAKMVQAYDHRAASVLIDRQNWVRQGQPEPTSLVSHQNPEFVVQPRWWVEESQVDAALGNLVGPAYLCYKDVTSPTNTRTMIAAFIPHVAVVNSAPLVLSIGGHDLRRLSCLLANLNSFVFDFVARQKVGGVHLNFFIVEQLPVLEPDAYDHAPPWDASTPLSDWISDRVMKLMCTADDMRPLAEACGFKRGVHKWREDDRGELMAELDAAFFLLYGIDRDDVSYILRSFRAHLGQNVNEIEADETEQLILTYYDRLKR